MISTDSETVRNIIQHTRTSIKRLIVRFLFCLCSDGDKHAQKHEQQLKGLEGGHT